MPVAIQVHSTARTRSRGGEVLCVRACVCACVRACVRVPYVA